MLRVVHSKSVVHLDRNSISCKDWPLLLSIKILSIKKKKLFYALLLTYDMTSISSTKFPCLQPERIDPKDTDNGYDIKSDVWSLGITLVSVCLIFMYL